MEKVVLFVLFAIIIFQVYKNIKNSFREGNRKVIVISQTITYLILLIWILKGSVLLLILALIILVVIISICLIKPNN